MGRTSYPRLAVYWLIAASLFFYGWWSPRYVLLVVAWMTANFWIRTGLNSFRFSSAARKALLVAGLAVDLGTLSYFKYANFLLANLGALTDHLFPRLDIILPLGISFFIFVEIAYLIDAYRRTAAPCGFLDYGLLVTFFPHMMAGPIVRVQELIPQFTKKSFTEFQGMNVLGTGLSMFAMGLFKKTIIADGIALYVSPVFRAAESGLNLGVLDAWLGVLAYTLQIYFDFSGYSDMAIGLGKSLNVSLPQNFNSPYKADNIIEFWRRWHISLSRFLKNYLYIPLGGNRFGKSRRYFNLMLTMLLGGLWHGAGWNFVIWGGLHGIFLSINHLWKDRFVSLPRVLSRAVTFIAVVATWVFFRAETFPGAIHLLRTMGGFEGAWKGIKVIDSPAACGWIFLLLSVCWFLPNSQEWMDRYQPALLPEGEEESPTPRVWHWKPAIPWAIFCGVMFGLSILALSNKSEFLYFQF